MMQLQKSNVIPPQVGQSDSFFYKFIYFIPLKLEVKLEESYKNANKNHLLHGKAVQAHLQSGQSLTRSQPVNCDGKQKIVFADSVRCEFIFYLLCWRVALNLPNTHCNEHIVVNFRTSVLFSLLYY